MLNKEAASICKVILRNGYDAYVINASLQGKIFELTQTKAVDIASEADSEILAKLFPQFKATQQGHFLGIAEIDGLTVRFYIIDEYKNAHPSYGLMRITPHMLGVLQEKHEQTFNAIEGALFSENPEEAFENLECGSITLKGIPFRALQRNYALAITALRLSANTGLPIDPTTWLSIIRASRDIAEYMSKASFTHEMRLVKAKHLWKFVQLLFDSCLLQSLLPEVSTLCVVKQQKSKEDATETNAFEHVISCMRHYKEEEEEDEDWLGTVAILFHSVGKVYTAEKYQDHWTFYQYHKIGAQVVRSILRRLHFESDEIDTVCNIVRNHIRFFSMLTDRGIRRFLTLPETDRIIELTRAHIKATGLSYTNFNHNLKYLERADLPETMVEPLLNGNEIMNLTSEAPGKHIGILRSALLQAQVEGSVKNKEEAIQFIQNFKFEE